MAIDQKQAGEADRDVDEKNHAPGKVADDQSAGKRPQHRADQAGYGDKTHGANESGFGERPYHGEPAYRQHHGAAAALQDAGGDEPVDVARNAAEYRSHRENADRGCEYQPRAVSVGDPPADRNKYGEAQRVTGEHRLHAE